MKNLIITLSLLLVLPVIVLQAQNQTVDLKGKALIDAIEKQNIGEIKKLISEGADVNYQQDVEGEKQTPLICASDGGTPEIVDILLKAGANPNKTGPVRRDTPLMYVAYNKTHAIAIAELLLAAGANPNQTGSEGLTALIWAVTESRTELVERLLKAGADINARGIYTALHAAVQFSTKEMVTLLLKNNANLNRLDAAGNTPLDYAYREKNTEMVEFLLAKGAKIAEEADGDDDEYDDYEEYDDEYYGDYELICECIEKKFTKATQRFIERICSDSDISADEIDTFIKEGADINAAFKISYYYEEDEPQISRPVFFLHGKALLHLINKGAKINITDDEGNTLLMRQLMHSNNEEVIKLLLAKKASVHARNEARETPLFIAIKNGKEEYVRLLLEHKVSPNSDPTLAKDYDYDAEGDLHYGEQLWLSPLEYAAYHSEPAIVELLLKYGAKVKETRAHIILAAKTQELEDGIRRFHGASAVMQSYSEKADVLWKTIIALLEKGADINAKDDEFNTLLYYAIVQQRLDMVKYIVEHGADPTNYARLAWGYHHHPNGETIRDYIYSVTETFDNEAREKSGYLPIHRAITERDLKKVTEILKATPSAAKALDKNDNTTLHVLFYSYDIEGSVDDYGISGYLAEIKNMATEDDIKPMLEALLTNGADIHAVNKNGKTPLHAAAEFGAPKELAAVLLSHAANVNAKDKFGKTPLHYVCDSETAELLIESGAHIHAVSSVLQRTPLHTAAMNRNPNIVKILLNAGAEKNAKDKYGNTPFDLVEYSNATLDALTEGVLTEDVLNEMMSALKPEADKSMLKYILASIIGVIALIVTVVVVRKRKKI